MHPTIFELNAFGRSRLPGPQGLAVLRHLRGGCARCLEALSPYLVFWLDDGPAAEARAADPRRHGKALVAECLGAAASAYRAAAKPKAPPDAGVQVDDAQAILEAEGPAAIGRMPRQLLGAPVVEALWRLTATLGAGDPRLRLRFAELAYDLAHRDPAGERRARELRCRAGVELANAHRVLGDLRPAQEELDRAREELLRGAQDPALAARLLVIQGLVMTDRWSHAAAHEALCAAARIYRRGLLIQGVAHACGSDAEVLVRGGKFDEALHRLFTGLQVLGREGAPGFTAQAIFSICLAQLALGRWREALDLLRRERGLLAALAHSRNASRIDQLEGRLLHRSGDLQGAVKAFTSCRDRLESLGYLYEAGTASLFWAAALEEHGDWDGSRARIMEGTDMILQLNLADNVYSAVMLLRTTRQFSATRDALPLERMVEFLWRAAYNPDLRLDSFLS